MKKRGQVISLRNYRRGGGINREKPKENVSTKVFLEWWSIMLIAILSLAAGTEMLREGLFVLGAAFFFLAGFTVAGLFFEIFRRETEKGN